LTREKGDTKEFRRLVLGEFFLAMGEEIKRMNNTSFQGLENQKTLGKLFGTKKKKKFKETQKSMWKKIACVKNELEKID